MESISCNHSSKLRLGKLPLTGHSEYAAFVSPSGCKVAHLKIIEKSVEK